MGEKRGGGNPLRHARPSKSQADPLQNRFSRGERSCGHPAAIKEIEGGLVMKQTNDGAAFIDRPLPFSFPTGHELDNEMRSPVVLGSKTEPRVKRWNLGWMGNIE